MHSTASARLRPPVESITEPPCCTLVHGWKRVMMRQPTLFLTVGLPCTGKTAAARRIEIEQKALRLTKDEWVKALYGPENPPSAQDVIEGRLI